MADDVVLNKAATIERCLLRVLEEYAGNKQNLVANQTKQDAIVLNLQRACGTAVDLAMDVITRKLSKALAEQGHEVSHTRVAQLLADMGYSLQGTLKTLDEASDPDRNNQFRYINRCVKVFQHAGQPVISVDAKKKELVGNFANAGREYRPQGQPEQVKMHDFPDPQLGKVCPYGVYDPTHNQGWVSVGIDHDTAQFAVESIRRWWEHMGKEC